MRQKNRWITCLNLSLLMMLTLCLCVGCKKREQTKQENETTQNTEEHGPESTTGAVITESESLDDVTLEGMSLDILNSMSLDEKIGQLIFAGADSLRDDDTGGKILTVSSDMEQQLKNIHPGGVILYSKNMKNGKQVKKLTEDLLRASHIPLFVGTEEEGGENSRISTVSGMKVEGTGSARETGEKNDSQLAGENGEITGTYMKELGFNVNFAPVADVITKEEYLKDEKNRISGTRSFGWEPELVADYVSAYVTKLQTQGVSAVLKYFPGQGYLKDDPIKYPADLERTIKELRKTEFLPFSSGIKAGTDFIMVGHASCNEVTGNQIPASLSSLMMSEILRQELQYDSVIITDSLNKKAITQVYSIGEAAEKAIRAGADMILCPSHADEAFEGIKKSVQEGKISEKRLDESVFRILKVKIKRGIIPENTDLIEKSK